MCISFRPVAFAMLLLFPFSLGCQPLFTGAEGDASTSPNLDPTVAPAEGALSTLPMRLTAEELAGLEDAAIAGPVLGVQHVRLQDETTGVIIEVKTGGDFLNVLIGNTEFNEDEDLHLEIGNNVLVTGPIVQLENERLLVAKTIDWNDRTIRFREEDGDSVW